MITIDNVKFRNLQEQVLKNQIDIASIKSIINLKMIDGKVNDISQLPSTATEGTLYLVGKDLYIYFDEWYNVGEFIVEGPQGPQGELGPQGPRGEDGTKIYLGTLKPTPTGDYRENDIYIDLMNGNAYKYVSGAWELEGTLRGPQGVKGPRGEAGPQGPQGEVGPQGQQGTASPIYVVRGILDDITQLPAPTTVEPNTAYIVGTDGEVKNLFVLISPDDDFAYWSNQGAFNTSALNASSISFENAGTTLSSTNVQTAIAELASDNLALQLQLTGLRTTVNNKDNELQGEINDIKASLNGTIFAVEPQEYKNIGVAVMDRANGYPIVDNQKSKLESIKGISKVVDGEIESTNITKIVVGGFNKFDGELEQGGLNQGIATTGMSFVRSKNFIQVIGGETYTLVESETSNKWKNRYVAMYDKNHNWIRDMGFGNSVGGYGKYYAHALDSNCSYIKLFYYADQSIRPNDFSDICFHLTGNGALNGVYKPYTPNINVNIQTGVLNGIGTAQDEITETELKKVIGIFDLGTLNWVYNDEIGHERFNVNISSFAKLPLSNGSKANILCAKYKTTTASSLYSEGSSVKQIALYTNASLTISDSDYTNAATFKQSLQGIMLYYETITPVITDEGFGEILFKVQRGGTIETDNNGDLTFAQVVYKPVE